jgi:hypothetical protein
MASVPQSVNLRSCPRREGRAKRTSGVGPTRVCVTGGESAAFGPVAECRREATSRKVLVRVQPGQLDVGINVGEKEVNE